MTDIILNKVVIHELVKTQHQQIQKSNIRHSILQASNPVVSKLVAGVTSLYGKNNNRAHYGIFRMDEGRGAFPDVFEEYALDNNPNEDIFLEITKSAMTALYKEAASSTPASGGYILFADYSSQGGRYFLTAMIKQKDGLKISEDLELEELIALDLSKLHQAARINFGKLSSYLAAKPEKKMDLSYLSFVSPRMGKAASGYFVTALGCAQGAASARATDTLIKEGFKFFRETEDLKKHRFDFKRDLIEYLTDSVKHDRSVKLSEVEKIARKYIPAEEEGQADEIASAFISLLNSEELAVPVEFPANKAILVKYTHIKYKSDNWELNFDRGALGEDDTAEIYYDQNRNCVTIKNLPAKAAEIFEQELKNRKLAP